MNFFFHPLLLSEISSIIVIEIRNRLVLLKRKSLNLSGQVLIVRLICIILMELKYLKDYEFGWAFCVNTNLNNFQDFLDPFCNCGQHIKTTIHFFLHTSNYSYPFENIKNIKRSSLNQNYKHVKVHSSIVMYLFK